MGRGHPEGKLRLFLVGAPPLSSAAFPNRRRENSGRSQKCTVSTYR